MPGRDGGTRWGVVRTTNPFSLPSESTQQFVQLLHELMSRGGERASKEHGHKRVAGRDTDRVNIGRDTG